MSLASSAVAGSAGGPVGAVAGVASSIVSSVLGSVLGFLDPGRARDANRQARADMYLSIAEKGSLYAARVLYGSQTGVYTIKEKAMYAANWKKLQAYNPSLAQQAIVMGGVTPPDKYPPDSPTQSEIKQMDDEIAAYQRGQSALVPLAPVPNATAAGPAGTVANNTALWIVLGIASAVVGVLALRKR